MPDSVPFRSVFARGQVIAMALVLYALAACAWAMEFPERPVFRTFDNTSGLPSNVVTGLAQDRAGYIWIGTDDGLARYDGIDFKVWQYDPDDDQSLPDNSVEFLHIDSRDRIWVALNDMDSGLAMLDSPGRTMHRFPELTRSCPGGVWTIASDETGAIWLGTSLGKLCRLNPDQTVTSYGRMEEAGVSRIYSLFIDERKHLWMGTNHGLGRLNSDGTLEFIAPEIFEKEVILNFTGGENGDLWISASQQLYRLDAAMRIEPVSWQGTKLARPTRILVDRNGGHWIGSAHGLFREHEGRVRLIETMPAAGWLTGNSIVTTIMQDHEGGLWVASATQGLAYLVPDWRRFAGYSHVRETSSGNFYFRNAISDGDQFLVAGSDGIYRLDPGESELAPFADLSALGPGWLWSIDKSSDGGLWIGRDRSYSQYFPATGRVRTWTVDNDSVNIVLAAPGGNVWIFSGQEGLQLRDRNGKILESIPPESESGPSIDDVSKLFWGPDGELWIAGTGGVFRKQGGVVRPILDAEGDTLHVVKDVLFETPSRVWLLRYGVIERYAWNGRILALQERLGKEQGVPAVDTSGLMLGHAGSIWATTARGLLSYRPGASQVRLYGRSDGLLDAEFFLRPAARNDSDMGLVVSRNAVTLIDLHASPVSVPRPRLVLESLKVRRDGVEHVIPSSGEVVLAPDDRELRITVHALSFVNPKLNRYRFRVDGYEREWLDQGNNNERIMSRLDPGNYRVEFQAANSEGDWSDVEHFDLRVLPPWWKSGWGIAFFVLLALLLLSISAHVYRRRLEQQHQYQMVLHRHELAEEASQVKTQFLATLGHEVRTPMTGVLGMSELLLATPLDDQQRRHIDSIRRAGNHLLRLVNDALDMARIESGKLELDPAPFALSELVADAADLARPLATNKGLVFQAWSDGAMPAWWHGDIYRIRQVLLNLLSNAVKFTDEGAVTLQVFPAQPKGLCFVVRDTGVGLSKEQRQRLFIPFVQAEGARTTARYGGSGLGLAISQELVLAMKGRIDVESTPGLGSVFSVTLPLDPVETAPAGIGGGGVSPPSLPKLKLLLVEDDSTVADVIAGLLRGLGHEVAHAAHGLAALAEMAEASFDMLLLDLDLPGIDGLSLAMQLRSSGFDGPLIAVTARTEADIEDRTRQAGFDLFLRKPVTGAMLARALDTAGRRSGSDDREQG